MIKIIGPVVLFYLLCRILKSKNALTLLLLSTPSMIVQHLNLPSGCFRPCVAASRRIPYHLQASFLLAINRTSFEAAKYPQKVYLHFKFCKMIFNGVVICWAQVCHWISTQPSRYFAWFRSSINYNLVSQFYHILNLLKRRIVLLRQC